MGKHGSSSAKPHKGWSNHAELLRQIHERAGHISSEEKEQIKKMHETGLVSSGIDKNGKRTWSGNGKALENSQCLCMTGVNCSFRPSGFGFADVEMLRLMWRCSVAWLVARRHVCLYASMCCLAMMQCCL